MKTLATGAAALTLILMATAGQAQEVPFRPVLSTTMERICTGETRQTFFVDTSGQVPLNQPTVTSYTPSFHAKPGAANGYVFEQTAQNADGDILLRADVSADGTVSNARISGSAIEPFLNSGQVNPSEFATNLANDIPERLIVGRAFRLGDSYYPPAIRDTLLGNIIQSFGVPFPVEGRIDITYRGRSTTQGRPSYDFAGTMSAQGSGQMDGITLGLNARTESVVSHDLETGLVLYTQNKVRTEVLVNGSLFRDFESSETITCTIRPR